MFLKNDATPFTGAGANEGRPTRSAELLSLPKCKARTVRLGVNTEIDYVPDDVTNELVLFVGKASTIIGRNSRKRVHGKR